MIAILLSKEKKYNKNLIYCYFLSGYRLKSGGVVVYLPVLKNM